MVAQIGTLNRFENESMVHGVYYSQTMVGCYGDEMFGCSFVGDYDGMMLNRMNHLGYRLLWWLHMVVGG